MSCSHKVVFPELKADRTRESFGDLYKRANRGLLNIQHALSFCLEAHVTQWIFRCWCFSCMPTHYLITILLSTKTEHLACRSWLGQLTRTCATQHEAAWGHSGLERRGRQSMSEPLQCQAFWGLSNVVKCASVLFSPPNHKKNISIYPLENLEMIINRPPCNTTQ